MHRLLGTIALLLAAASCAKRPVEEPPDYARELPPGESALRLVVDPVRLPDVAEACRTSGPQLRQAIDHSLAWFRAPSSARWFPFGDITHERAAASLRALRQLLDESEDETRFAQEFARLFDVYESVGYDMRGTVLFTGYCAPVFAASRVRTQRYRHPLYRRPADLVSDPVTGEVQGRRMPDGSIAPYPTRREIEGSGMLKGTELVWLADALAAYIVHVNGSARLLLQDGQVMHVGYAGKTDRPYRSLGQMMVERGLFTKAELSLASIQRVYRSQPELARDLMLENESYVFFAEYDGTRWPAGSLGVPVTGLASLATDKKVFPRGGPVIVETKLPCESSRFVRFLLDQDTGGAIRAPGRADIFMGVGPAAELLAGHLRAEGRLFYVFLKPEHVAAYAGD